jgi:RNase P protein component
VVRNKIKRLLAEEIRKNLDKFENGFRGIFLIKKNIIDEKGNLKDIKFL